MPTYTFLNKDTQETWTEIMSMSEREELLHNSPNIIQLLTVAPTIGDPYTLGRMKPSTQFREQLKRIKKGSGKSSTIDTGNLTHV